MSTDPWSKSQAPMDWSEQVDEEIKRGTLKQDSFPSLSEAAASKGGKKKKPPQKMGLSEFMQNTEGIRQPGSRPLTDKELLMTLPKAPKEKDPNQPRQSWKHQNNYNRGRGYEDRGRRHRNDEFRSSRADDSSNWGDDRRGSLRSYSRSNSRERESHHSRAPEDNWSRDNRFQPSSRGYGDHRRQGYGFHSGGDRWGHDRSGRTPPPADSGRPKLDLLRRSKPMPDPINGPELAVGRTKNNPFGDAKPREEVLKERGTSSEVFSSRSDIGSEQDYRSQPGSPGGSYRGSSISGQDSREVIAPRPKPRPDPFGGAKPREVVLNERHSRSGRGTPSSQ